MRDSGPKPSPVYLLTRIALIAVGGALWFWFAGILANRNFLTGPNNPLYLTLLGLLLGYLAGGTVARRAEYTVQGLNRKLSRVPPEAVLAAGSGAILALLVAVLMNNVLAAVPGFTWYWSLLITITLITASSWFFVVNRHLFSFGRPSRSATVPEQPSGEGLPKIIDTSAIIDGRIVDVVEANFLDGILLIPKLVLGELQHIADSDDPLRRRRGRRGLEMLDRLVQQHGLPSQVIGDDPVGAAAVDEKLIHICKLRGADLITTDYNLNRVAALQGVRVLNINQLANAVKAMFLPGERLSLNIVKEGREPGQGLAYLEDGTMVVVEDAAGLVGRTIDTIVTSSLQTNMGRMIFAKPEVSSN